MAAASVEASVSAMTSSVAVTICLLFTDTKRATQGFSDALGHHFVRLWNDIRLSERA